MQAHADVHALYCGGFGGAVAGQRLMHTHVTCHTHATHFALPVPAAAGS